MPKRMEKTSTLQLRTPSQIDRRNAPRVLAIPTVPSCLAKPEMVNLVSEVPGNGQNKTQNLPRTTLSLVEEVVRARSLKRAVGAVKRSLQSDLGRARGWLQRLEGKLHYVWYSTWPAFSNDPLPQSYTDRTWDPQQARDHNECTRPGCILFIFPPTCLVP